MYSKFVSSVMLWWILRTQLLYANAESSCKNEVPDISLNRILSDGNLNFSLNLYKELKRGKNVVFSPFSIRVALAMTAAGTRGNTLTQMNRALELDRFQSEDQINTVFQSVLSSFCPNNNYALSTANRIYMQQDFLLSKSFSQTLEKSYLSSAENVNFRTDAYGVAKKISTWVEKQTNGTIKGLIPPGSLPSDTVLFLVNAIYFKGKWKTQFNPTNTKPQTFNLANGRKVEVPIMHVSSDFKHSFSAALRSQILQMDYDGSRLAMHIILPQEGISLYDLQKDLNSKNVNDYMDTLFIEQVNVYLPKFKASYRVTLNGPLQSLGMVDVFGSADLSRMTSAGRVRVSSLVHQAYVAVDEEGTTVAAATGVAAMPMSASFDPSNLIEFRVDRPCIYLIYDLTFKQVLFMGNLDDPSIK